MIVYKSLIDSPTVFRIHISVFVGLLTASVTSVLAFGAWHVPLICIMIAVVIRTICFIDSDLPQVLGAYLMLASTYLPSGSQYKGKDIASMLPSLNDVDPEQKPISVNKDGVCWTLYRTIAPDHLTLPEDELKQKLDKMNQALNKLAVADDDIVIQYCVNRKSCHVDSHMKDCQRDNDLFARNIIRKDYSGFCNDNQMFENEISMALLYKQPAIKHRFFSLSRLFIESDSGRNDKIPSHERFGQILKDFEGSVQDALSLTSMFCREKELFLNRFFFSQTSVKDPGSDPVFSPEEAVYKGLSPLYGKRFIKAVGFTGFPTQINPDMAKEILRLGFEYNWTTRFQLLHSDKALRLLRHKKTQWCNAAVNLKSIFRSMIVTPGIQTDESDLFELSNAEEIDEVMDGLKRGQFALGWLSSSIIVLDEDEAAAIKKAETIMGIVKRYQLQPRLESLNTLQSLFSSIPGTSHQNPRRHLIPSNAFSAFIPFTSPWQGDSPSAALFIANGRD